MLPTVSGPLHRALMTNFSSKRDKGVGTPWVLPSNVVGEGASLSMPSLLLEGGPN